MVIRLDAKKFASFTQHLVQNRLIYCQHLKRTGSGLKIAKTKQYLKNVHVRNSSVKVKLITLINNLNYLGDILFIQKFSLIIIFQKETDFRQ